MKNRSPKVVFCALAAALTAFALLCPPPVEGADARVYLKNRMMPLFIQNLQIQYTKENASREALILMQTDQQKYLSYGFEQVRKFEIAKFVGARNEAPVYQVEVHLVETGDPMMVLLMPVMMISGRNQGVIWKYKLNLSQGYEENVQNLKAIEFIKPPK